MKPAPEISYCKIMINQKNSALYKKIKIICNLNFKQNIDNVEALLLLYFLCIFAKHAQRKQNMFLPYNKFLISDPKRGCISLLCFCKAMWTVSFLPTGVGVNIHSCPGTGYFLLSVTNEHYKILEEVQISL